MASDFFSGIWEVSGIDLGSVEIAWASFSNAGADANFKLEASNAGVVWDLVGGTEYTIPATSATGSKLINLDRVGYRKLRLSYSHGAAAAGTLTAVATLKVLTDNGIAGNTLG